jgi:AraC-like DNA-binding protein
LVKKTGQLVKNNHKINFLAIIFFVDLHKIKFMLKTILLLSPVYVTLFWAILLNFTVRDTTNAKKFLGKFMIFAFLVYISHFIFYYPLKDFYFIIDPIYQFASLMVYPLYYIYLKLLTVEKSFLFRKHFKFLILPFSLFFLYLIGGFFANPEDLKIWVYKRNTSFDALEMQYLKLLFFFIRFTFLSQALYLMIKSLKLLKQYADKAEQYYSDIEDSKNSNVKTINISMILTGIFSVVIAALGRDFFQEEIIMIALASFIFSTLLFIIGWMGYKQKSVHAIVETYPVTTAKEDSDENNIQYQSVLLSKILYLFENQKIYLKENLNIIDLANLTGTNRTYISNLINNHYHQNFCTFVNTFRLEDVKKHILDNPTSTNQILAEKCGFSSADSMKRVVKNISGLSVTELKNKLLKA